MSRPLAFVLSGGGARGALQVGALQVLLERGYQPDLLVGASAGALNAAFLASNPSAEGARRLAEVWKGVSKEIVYPGSHLSVLWRLVRNAESLYTNENFQRFVRCQLRAVRLKHFNDITTGVRLYILAAHLSTGAEHVFGDRPDDLLLDAVMASSALPPLHPPWRCDGDAYVDGAFASELPVHVAAERGAEEIFALHITDTAQPAQPLRSAVDITVQAMGAFTKQQLQNELQVTDRWPDLKLHYVPLTAYPNWPVWDFRYGSEMILEGRKVMAAYLNEPARAHSRPGTSWQRVLRAGWRTLPFGRREKTIPGTLAS